MTFKTKARAALKDKNLHRALGNIKRGFVVKRAKAIDKLPEFERMRDHAVSVKDHTLQNLDQYLKQFEAQVNLSGGHVHWAHDAKAACDQVISICQSHQAKNIVKSKSMLTEEIELNDALEAVGLNVTETDLGEYIIQQRREKPSHIVAPAIHLLKEHVAEIFHQKHTMLDPKRSLEDPDALLKEARTVLREKYFTADVGITGANFLIAESGTSVLVTNEGNGDLIQTLSKVHIVIASIEKVVPTFEDTAQMLRLLTRSATGQAITSYVTFSTGPKREGDWDGPEVFHVIILDNGRRKLLGGVFEKMLRCIRCGACLNHCPVYQSIGGQAYGSVYPGPMGSVLTPALFGIKKHADLPNASTFCGRCEDVCPMKIPLPNMMRHFREQEYQKKISSSRSRIALKLWAFLAMRPKLYHRVMRCVAIFMRKKPFHAQYKEKQ